MYRHPYDDHNRDKMVLWDWMAMDRTVFAAARTFNDYIKIFITAVIATIVFLVIFNGKIWDEVIYLGLVFAGMMLVAGLFLLVQAYLHHRNLHHE